MLTAAQRELRQHGVGASEIAMIVGLHPYKGALDVWLAKATPTRPPIVIEHDDEAGAPTSIGQAIEDGLRSLYEQRTGLKMRRARTLRHRALPYVLATPDGLGTGSANDVGLEIKVVGARMAHHWQGDYVPDYVLSQAAQGMAVTGRSRWDVVALIGGTDLRIIEIERDLELEASLLEAARDFWEGYVLADVMPEPRDPAEHRRYLLARYPGSAATKCDVDESPETRALVEQLTAAKTALEAAEALEADLTNKLCAIVGDRYGVEGRWGKFIWPSIQGQVSWRDLAEELAGGAIADALLTKHRRPSYRRPNLYGPKKSKERSR